MAEMRIHHEPWSLTLGCSGVQENFLLLLLLFWPCCVACRILVPQPGIKPVLSALEARSPNHWTAREFPRRIYNLGPRASLR